MRKEKKTSKYYWEVSLWDSWPEMLFAIELRPKKAVYGFTFTIGLTVLYRVLFFFEYTRFKNEINVTCAGSNNDSYV